MEPPAVGLSTSAPALYVLVPVNVCEPVRSATLLLSAESATLPAVLMVASFVSAMAALAATSASVIVPSAIFRSVSAHS